MVHDVNQFGVCIEPKATTTLNNMRKADLIKYIRELEHDYNAVVTFNKQQAKILKEKEEV